MMIEPTKRAEFITNFLKIIEKILDKELPQEGFEDEMIEKAYDIVYKRIRHIKGGGYEV